MLFDEAHLANESLMRVKEGAEEFIRDRMVPGRRRRRVREWRHVQGPPDRGQDAAARGRPRGDAGVRQPPGAAGAVPRVPAHPERSGRDAHRRGRARARRRARRQGVQRTARMRAERRRCSRSRTSSSRRRASTSGRRGCSPQDAAESADRGARAQPSAGPKDGRLHVGGFLRRRVARHVPGDRRRKRRAAAPRSTPSTAAASSTRSSPNPDVADERAVPARRRSTPARMARRS